MNYRSLIQSTFCTLFVFGLVYGQGDDKRANAPMRHKMVKQMNLSDAQNKEIGDLDTDFAKQRVQQQAKIKTAAIDLHKLMWADSPDKAAIEKKINEIGELQTQNRMQRVNHWFAVNNLLNPDQQKIWKNVLRRSPRARFAARMHLMREGMMRSHRRPSGPGNSMQ